MIMMNLVIHLIGVWMSAGSAIDGHIPNGPDSRKALCCVPVCPVFCTSGNVCQFEAVNSIHCNHTWNRVSWYCTSGRNTPIQSTLVVVIVAVVCLVVIVVVEVTVEIVMYLLLIILLLIASYYYIFYYFDD